MKRMHFFFFLAVSTMILMSGELSAQKEETIFANYFDIPVNSYEGTEVTGRIHLERNKDVRLSPVPAGYHFEIIDQEQKLFRIETRYDLSKRILGVFTVEKGQNTGSIPVFYRMTVALKNNDQVLKKLKLSINIVEETLWTNLHQSYKDLTVSNRGSRMYGRNQFSDKQVQRFIEELEKGNGRFAGIHCYERYPSDYLNQIILDPVSDRRYGTIEHEWEKVAARIGGLGYAYAKSGTYGPQGDTMDRIRLRKALYSAILAYT
ncbi:MAG: silent information regulator protein Sir2, partial [Bacteroidales bacterium]|nr:silent information regulator protein Sir2 [Bacteroidales bacterium]